MRKKPTEEKEKRQDTWKTGHTKDARIEVNCHDHEMMVRLRQPER